MAKKTTIRVAADGSWRAVVDDVIESILPAETAPYVVRRASHVDVSDDLCEEVKLAYLNRLGRPPEDMRCVFQPNAWWADLSPVNGPLLGPFLSRSSALEAEVEWLHAAGIPAVASR